jgi:hypothetical protein
MSHVTCNDCGKTGRKRLRAYAIGIDKKPLFVCMECWKKYEYGEFVKEFVASKKNVKGLE